MKFVFPRDRTIASVFGHTIHFIKDEPTHVPPEMYKEVLAAGGMPEKGVDLEPPKPTTQKFEPADPVEREKAIFEAFTKLVERGQREDFTAGGQPHGKALQTALGWSLNNKERDILWVKFQNLDAE